MKLYYAKGACSLVVRILINELRLSAEYEAVDLKIKKTETGKDFLKINPKGAVPTLQIDNNEILTENAVILQYLADTNHATELLPAVGNFNRYRVLEWTNYVTTELHKSIGIKFHPILKQEVKDTTFHELISKKLDYLNQHLKNNKFLCGDHLTIADPYLFVMMRWLSVHFNFNLSDWPAIARFFNEMKARPAVEKSLEQEGLLERSQV